MIRRCNCLKTKLFVTVQKGLKEFFLCRYNIYFYSFIEPQKHSISTYEPLNDYWILISNKSLLISIFTNTIVGNHTEFVFYLS